MGWKTLKEQFRIEHIVQVTEAGVCIGSGYVHDLATINPQTGRVSENNTFSRFLQEHCPALLAATPEQILQALAAKDVFSASITVYTYGDSGIVEKQCEATGWPNVTHDGWLMYDNRFSTDKRQVVQWAKRNAHHGVRYGREGVEEAEQELARRKAHLAEEEARQAHLDREFPDVVLDLAEA